MYHPTLGRWVTRDPHGYVDGMNLMFYVCANPVRYLDPYGGRAVDANGNDLDWGAKLERFSLERLSEDVIVVSNNVKEQIPFEERPSGPIPITEVDPAAEKIDLLKRANLSFGDADELQAQNDDKVVRRFLDPKARVFQDGPCASTLDKGNNRVIVMKITVVRFGKTSITKEVYSAFLKYVCACIMRTEQPDYANPGKTLCYEQIGWLFKGQALHLQERESRPMNPGLPAPDANWGQTWGKIKGWQSWIFGSTKRNPFEMPIVTRVENESQDGDPLRQPEP